jgi:hypothetical protein
MRHNMFNEVYCHTVDEVREHIDTRHDADWQVYATTFEPQEGPDRATCEVLENGSGDLVCYIECDTIEQVRAAVLELKLEMV